MNANRSVVRSCFRPAAVIAGMTCIAGAPDARATNPALLLHNDSLTTYKVTAKTPVQDARPAAVAFRVAYIDGAARTGAGLGMSLAANPAGGVGWSGRGRGPGGILLGTGTYEATTVDLSLPARGGSAWGVMRSHCPRQKDSVGNYYPSQGPFGDNWFHMSQPEIQLYDDADNALDMVYVITSGSGHGEYKRSGSSSNVYRGVNGTAGIVFYEQNQTNGEPDTYTLYDEDSTRFVFFGFDGDASPCAGQFWKKIDPAGNTAYVGHATTGSTAISQGYNANGKIIKAYDGEARLYEYTISSGRYTKCEVKVDSGSGYVATGYKVDYTYYTSTETDKGTTNDLKTVKITTPMSDTTDDVRVTYYRYYTGAFNASTNPGHEHSIRMIVDSAGYNEDDYAGDTTFDDDPLSESESTLKTYASAYFKYDSDRRIVSAWFNGACGCGGGSGAGEHTFEYETQSYTNNAGYDTDLVARTTVDTPGTDWSVQNFDEVNQPCGHIVADGNPDNTGPSPNFWPTRVIRDSNGCITEIRSLANTTYTHSSWSFSSSSSVGLINLFTRVASGDATGFVEYTKHKEGTSGTEYYDSKAEYDSGATATITVGSYVFSRIFPSAMRRYTVEGTSSSSNYDATTMAYTFWTGDAALMPKKVVTTSPKVPTSQNGRGDGVNDPAVETVRCLRKDGTAAFVQDPSFSDAAAGDRVYSYTKYTNGVVTMSIRDVTTSDTTDIDTTNDDLNGIFGLTESGDGKHIKTIYTYDTQKRLDETTRPDGRVTKMHYTVLADRRDVVLSIPRKDTSPSTIYYGPVAFTVMNDARQAEATGAIEFSGGTTSSTPATMIDETDANPLDMEGAGSVCRLTVNIVNEPGTRVEETRAYHDIPTTAAGDSTSKYDKTTFAYDDSGRKIRAEAADGTVTRTVYDAIGRFSSGEVGTNDNGDTGSDDVSGTNDMVATSEVTYDAGGVGNGHVTKRTAFPQATTTGRRDVNYSYNYRGRNYLVENPAAPTAVLTKFDNLGRSVAVGVYSSTSGITASTDPTSTSSNRLDLSETAYDTMGRAWKSTDHAIDTSDGTDDDTLITEHWFNAREQTLKTDGPSLVKYEYDHPGRLVKTYVLAKEDGSAAWSNADDVSGDLVLEEHQTVYEDYDSDNVVMTVRILRAHDDLANETTGALDENLDGVADSSPLTLSASDVNGVAQIGVIWYDALDRPIARGNYGTNGYSDFTYSSTVVTSSSSSVLVTETTYNDDGTVLEQNDADDKKTRFEYDDLGRVTKQIANYVNGTPSGANGADDVTTVYTYSNGHRTKLIADIDGNGEDSGDQVTTYVYGTTKGTLGSGSPPQSVIGTGYLLREVIYPEQVASQAAADRTVYHAYNAQGEVAWMKDPIGNIHQYDFDLNGRRTQDRVTTFVSPTIDTIKRIATVFDSLGRVSTVTTYDDPDVGEGTAKSQTERTYSIWGLVTEYEQDPDSAIGSSGRAAYSVTYTYEVADGSGAGGRNTVRRTGMTYPGSSDSLVYEFLSTGNLLDNDASRVTRINISGDASLALVEYDYLGTGTVVGTDLLEPEVRWELFEGAAGGDLYPHFDRWLRTEMCQWERYSKVGSDRYIWNESVIYSYAGDITSREDNVQTVGAAGSGYGLFDVGYTLDGLHRLTKAEEGNWNTTLNPDAIDNRTREEDWTLDQLANFDEYKRDLDGDINFNETDEFYDNRGFNDVNELRSRDTDNNGATDTNDYEPDYDKNGNLIDDDKRTPTGTYTYRYGDYDYDAWNRLVAVRNQSGTLVAEYTYNGEGHMTSSHDDTDTDGDVDGSDATFYKVNTPDWKQVAEFLGTNTDAKFLTYFHTAGDDGLGGSSYIDAPFRRRMDLSNGRGGAADGTFEKSVDLCQRFRPDIAVVVNSADGKVVNWIEYFSYGREIGLPSGDINGTGAANAGDTGQIQTWVVGGTYDVRADTEGDNDIDVADLSAWAGYTMGLGVPHRSDVTANPWAWCGYVRDYALADSFYHVRYRAYNTLTGWIQRDPLSNATPIGLYIYAASPLSALDPQGLKCISIAPDGPGCGEPAPPPCISGAPDAPGCGEPPPPPCSSTPEVRYVGCDDPLVQQALNSRRVQLYLEAALMACARHNLQSLCQPSITIICDPNCEDSTTSCFPPSIRLCTGGLIGNPTQRLETLINRLVHELVHARQCCDDPDNFYVGCKNAICAEVEAYCAQNDIGINCDDPASVCGWACNSAQHCFWFGDKYAKCMTLCKKVLKSCRRGFYQD